MDQRRGNSDRYFSPPFDVEEGLWAGTRVFYLLCEEALLKP